MFKGGFDVMLYARDMEKSLSFYRDVLGMPVTGYWDHEANAYVSEWAADGAPTYFELSAGGQKIAVHHSEEEVAAGGAIYHIEVADVDALHATVTERGLEAKDPSDSPWGWRMFFVRDPDGHVLGFYRPLA